MKKLLIIILLLVPSILSAQESSAQERSLINRTDGQTGARIQTTTRSDKYPLLQQSVNSFKITFPKTTIPIDSGKITELIGKIDLLGNDSVQINFHRTHLHLPDGWTTSICFGSSCYATTTDSLIGGFTFNKAFNSTFTLDFLCPRGATQIDSIIDYITLNNENGVPGDTVSFILKGIFSPQASVQDAQTKASTSSPKIKAIYPSPLVSGNEIKVKITSPGERSLSYSIYDAVGRIVALGVTRQRLNLGDNTIGIGSLEGLMTGSYMLKLSFGDGSSDTYFFQVMR
jgi:hypothetical protein